MVKEQDQGVALTREELSPTITSVLEKLTKLQIRYGQLVEAQRKQLGIENRGCGPGSFILAKLLQRWLTSENDLPITASLGKSEVKDDGIYLFFGAQKESFEYIDHAWVELVLGDQVLLISHESQKHGPKASYRIAGFRKGHEDTVYDQIGFVLLADKEMKLFLSLDDVAFNQITTVISEINTQQIPSNYEAYVNAVYEALVDG